VFEPRRAHGRRLLDGDIPSPVARGSPSHAEHHDDAEQRYRHRDHENDPELGHESERALGELPHSFCDPHAALGRQPPQPEVKGKPEQRENDVRRNEDDHGQSREALGVGHGTPLRDLFDRDLSDGGGRGTLTVA
jgi:hypothetical protein